MTNSMRAPTESERLTSDRRMAWYGTVPALGPAKEKLAAPSQVSPRKEKKKKIIIIIIIKNCTLKNSPLLNYPIFLVYRSLPWRRKFLQNRRHLDTTTRDWRLHAWMRVPWQWKGRVDLQTSWWVSVYLYCKFVFANILQTNSYSCKSV